MTFEGFDRGARGIGVRDVVLVVPSVGCTNRVVELVGRSRPDVRVATHQHGCSQLGSDLALTKDVLAGVCANPNVRGAVVVSLGCESNEPNAFVAYARERGANVRLAGFQDLGGTNATIDRVNAFVDELLAEPVRRADATLGDLTVGLLGDAPTDDVASALESAGVRVLTGALVGERARGAPASTVHAVWTRRQLPVGRGVDAQSPVERMTAMAAAGAQVLVFVTARGDPTASPVSPTIKVGAGIAIEGVIDVEDASEVVPILERVAAGELTAGERAGQRDFGIPRLSPTL